MTSAVPYDPYDDLDNNPFAEPQEEGSEPAATTTDGSSSMSEERVGTEQTAASVQDNGTANNVQNGLGGEGNATRSKTSNEHNENQQPSQSSERVILPERSDEKKKIHSTCKSNRIGTIWICNR